jgi:predicted RNA-binding protein
MCSSTVYDQKIHAEHALLKNEQSFRTEGRRLFFTDILEREHEFKGELVSADLVNGSVIINLGN